MKITKMIMTLLASMVIATLGIISAPTASAGYPIEGKLGSPLTFTDTVGQTVITYTVSDLKPSGDMTPGFGHYGQLWQATATVRADRGPVTPAVSQFNAVAPWQAAYRVLWQVATPQGLSAATIPQGGSATGIIYFDVTGPPPTVVTMNNGMQDLLIWTS